MPRRSWHGFRIPRYYADEAARFIEVHGVTVRHQKRSDASKKCPVCWDELADYHSPACTTCGGTGYLLEIYYKKAYVSFSQPYGNYGSGAQVFKAGGRNERMSAYIYMTAQAGQDVEIGDSLFVSVRGYEDEFVVMNKQPQIGSAGTVLMYVFETASNLDRSLKNSV